MTMMKKTILALGIATAMGLPTGLYAKTNAKLPLDEIRNFVDVYNSIRSEYVEEKEGKTLIDYAIEGMLSGLDPHSVYLQKDDLKDLEQDTDGSYVGFGVQLDIVDGDLIIVSPIADSPAEKAGLKPNDRIIKIDETVIEDLSMKAVSDLLEASDTVTLTILRKGEEPKAYEVTKTTVNLPSVSHKILESDYGYIRVSQFQADTDVQFADALSDLQGKNIKGLVLDLRNNPGGLINSATGIADAFLDAGLIVSTKNQNTGSEDKIHANEETLAKDLPLVVLINDGSASASELLAGALQDHKRAVIVGQQSFGKGSVQTILPLDNGSAIKLTTARYYTPNGTSIQAKGITPDIALRQLSVDEAEKTLLSYGEANIPKHLNGDKKDAENDAKEPAEKETSKADDDKKDGDKTDLAKSDLQLFEALNVLKVLIFKQ